ncbi:DUF2381 family protein [Corallococcus praedator]|uniref:DUF2381 family protein n=1 Tax=Corallococcus praedator TaxID=2316724 RepID=A0ABX9QL83_9BACT|nr:MULTISPECIES: DUF2381 family protein [Corallococcus]RKH33304.1 DUF2381 family protein [Corallococcus sp. CA031C]RKI12269.1 DUF2381 family protein [Corallococcus praedator]
MLLLSAAVEAREPAVRTVLLSEHPEDSTPSVYVKGAVSTVLRFEAPVDASKTRMLAWEGRFEPLLVGGRKVVVEPLRDLAEDEGVPLLVTLTNGREIPLLLRPPGQGRRAELDQQVNVFEDRQRYEAMYSTLMDSLKQQRVLKEENARLRQEEHSTDHALATLLANGDFKHTPFTNRRRWALREEGANIVVEVLTSKTVPKVAVLFSLTNHDAKNPWSLMEARLSTVSGGKSRPFALRVQHDEIAPGATGRIAVVADDSVFQSPQGLEQLALELFRSDGLSQAYLVLEWRLFKE